MEMLSFEEDISCLQEECNTTWINTGNLPSIPFLRSLPALERSLVITTFIVALLGNCLYVVQIALLWRKKCGYTYIKFASTLLALYPVYETMSFLAMIIPRAISIISVLIGAYTMIVFNDFSNMISFVFGGFSRLLDKMDGQELQKPRLCACLPKMQWTKKRVILVRALIRQGKLVFYIYVVMASILLLNGNYEKRPLEFNRPLFWFSVLAGTSRFVATISLVFFVRSVVMVITGYSLGKKFVALQIINLFHLFAGFVVTFLKSRNLPVRAIGLVSAENRIDIWGYFLMVLVTAACQLWAFALFYRSPKPAVTPQSSTRRGGSGGSNGGGGGGDSHPRRTSSSYTVDTVQSSVIYGVDDSVRQVAANDDLTASAAADAAENPEGRNTRVVRAV